MRIAIISTMAAFPWGGSEELWAQMAVSAVTSGHEVMALIPKWPVRHSKIDLLTKKGVQISEWFEKNTHPDFNVEKGKSPWYPYESLVEFNPNIVCISHGGFLDIVNGHSLLFAMLAHLRIPFVTIIQANTDLYNIEESHRSFMREYLSQARQVLFVSKENQKIAERHLARHLPNSCLINNPVNLNDYSEVPWPESTTMKIACVARFDSWAKGHDILLETLSGDQWKGRDWQLSLYGAGDHENYIHQLVEHYNLPSHVSFCGVTNDIRSIWKEHHMLILASRLEGTPLVLMESMLCGRPAIVTNVGGNADWVLNMETGFLALGANVDLLNYSLEEAWANQDQWEIMGKKAREFFLANHEVSSGDTLLTVLTQASS